MMYHEKEINTNFTGDYHIESILDQRTNENGEGEYKVSCSFHQWLPQDYIQLKHPQLFAQYQELLSRLKEQENKPLPKKRGRKRKVRMEPVENGDASSDEKKTKAEEEEKEDKKPWRSQRRQENVEKENFYCKYCEETFYTKMMFTQHMQDHEEEGIDPEVDANGIDLSKSYTTVTKGKRIEYHCIECKKVCKEVRDAKAHLRVHDGTNPWHCKRCSKHFLRKAKFDKHMHTHSRSRDYNCLHCQKVFDNQDVLEKHLATCFSLKSKSNPNFSSNNLESDMHCTLCDKKYSKKSAFDIHLSLHLNSQGHLCPTCCKDFSSKVLLQEHMKMHTDNLFQCDMCGEVFPLSEDLEMHYQMSEMCLDVMCIDCKYRFDTVDSLYNHLDLTEEEFDKKICAFCHCGFHTEEKLVEHIKKIHVVEKPVKCESCDVMVGTENLLKIHTRDVHDPKPVNKLIFPCVDCPKSFKDATSLKTHIKICHLAEKHNCIPCGKKFPSQVELNKHMLTKQHQRTFNTQSTPRNHKCNICSKAFYSNKELDNHMLTHQRVENLVYKHEASLQSTNVVPTNTPIFLNDGLVSIDLGDGRQVVLNEEQAAMLNGQINIDESGNICSFICVPDENKNDDGININIHDKDVQNSIDNSLKQEELPQQDVDSEENNKLHFVLGFGEKEDQIDIHHNFDKPNQQHLITQQQEDEIQQQQQIEIHNDDEKQDQQQLELQQMQQHLKELQQHAENEQQQEQQILNGIVDNSTAQGHIEENAETMIINDVEEQGLSDEIVNQQFLALSQLVQQGVDLSGLQVLQDDDPS